MHDGTRTIVAETARVGEECLVKKVVDEEPWVPPAMLPRHNQTSLPHHQ